MDHYKILLELVLYKIHIFLYKKVLQDTARFNAQKKVSDQSDSNTSHADTDEWKGHFTVNPQKNEYGNGVAHIIDYAITDGAGSLTATIDKGSEFTIKSKVLFHEAVWNPIFTFTFKNARGVDITGTNTRIENTLIEPAAPGDVYVASFTQRMNLQSGDYLLSISCTGIVDGELVVYHRLYDLLQVTVVSIKDTVGFYDMDSKAVVEKV